MDVSARHVAAANRRIVKNFMIRSLKMPFSADVLDFHLKNRGVRERPFDVGFAFGKMFPTVFFDKPLQPGARVFYQADFPENDAAFECRRELFGFCMGVLDYGEAGLGIALEREEFFARVLCAVKPDVLAVECEIQRNAVRIADGICRGKNSVFGGFQNALRVFGCHLPVGTPHGRERGERSVGKVFDVDAFFVQKRFDENVLAVGQFQGKEGRFAVEERQKNAVPVPMGKLREFFLGYPFQNAFVAIADFAREFFCMEKVHELGFFHAVALERDNARIARVFQLEAGFFADLAPNAILRAFALLEFSADANPLVAIDVVLFLDAVEHQVGTFFFDVTKGRVEHIGKIKFKGGWGGGLQRLRLFSGILREGEVPKPYFIVLLCLPPIDFVFLLNYIYGMTKAELKFLQKKAKAAYEAMLNFPAYDENHYRKLNHMPLVRHGARSK